MIKSTQMRVWKKDLNHGKQINKTWRDSRKFTNYLFYKKTKDLNHIKKENNNNSNINKDARVAGRLI